VIAHEEDGLREVGPITSQALDDLRRLGPAIDQVAEEDDRDSRMLPRRIVRFDAPQEVVQQVKTSVDISDGIGPPSYPNGGSAALQGRSPA
jgi:hypothetical protein